MEGFCPLASGSRGNCLFFGTRQTKILIDAGLSGRTIQKKLKEINVDLSEIQAILITHEHTDHILGLSTLALRMGIPVIANRETAKRIYAVLQICPKFKIFTTGETFTFGDIEIHPFPIQHDAVDPVAFTLKYDSIKLGICTDLGFATSIVQTNLKDCDYLVVESNHEPFMVHASRRPKNLKDRILGPNGHLSNEACASLLEHITHPRLKHVHLAHLSQECNSPHKAIEAAKRVLGSSISLAIAPQEVLGECIAF